MAGTGKGARWTLARRRQFLAALAISADAEAAACAVGETLRAARALRARDPAFGEAWDQAIGAAHALVEEGLLRRMLALLRPGTGRQERPVRGPPASPSPRRSSRPKCNFI